MSWMRFFKRDTWDAERAAEMQAHLQHEADEFVAQGMSRDDAQAAARRKLGNETKLREEIYEMNSVGWLDSLWQDLRYALRMLRKSPGYAAVAVLTLALGIGANTAIFTLIDSVMLRTVPVSDPSHLYVAGWQAKAQPDMEWSSSYSDCGEGSDAPGSNPSGCSFPKPFYQDLRANTKVFSAVAAFAGPARMQLSGNGAASIVSGSVVTGDYFSTLGVNPALGRMLTPADDVEGAPQAVVLSYAFWRSNFGGDPLVVGRSIDLNGAAFTIAGVAEQKFTNFAPGKPQQLWVTMAAARTMGVSWAERPEGVTNWWMVVVARLAPGVTQAQAQAEATITFRNEIIHGEKPLAKETDDVQTVLTPVQAGLVGRRDVYSTRLYVLMCAVGLILLIACANVAGLLLARSTARQKEMALRLALGAKRMRIVRQLLTESVLLSFLGGVMGVAVAYWGVQAITTLLGSGSASRFTFVVSMDWRVLLFTLGVATCTGLFFGLAPAMRSTRLDLTSALKENAPTAAIAGDGRWWRRASLGSVLVVAQVALCVVVMIGAGLMVRTLDNLRRIDPGFNTRNVLLFDLDPGRTGMKDEQAILLYDDVRERLAAMPGVISATYSSGELMSGGQWTEGLHVEGTTAKDGFSVDSLAIGPGFLRASGIGLLAGRGLEGDDFARAARNGVEMTKQAEARQAGSDGPKAGAFKPAFVQTVVPVLVNRSFVEKYLHNASPLGTGLVRGGHSGATAGEQNEPPSRAYEIVGVVQDTKYGTLRAAVQPMLLVPNVTGGVEFEMRTAGDPNALVPAVREVVQKADSSLPVTEIRTRSEQIDRLMEAEIFLARLVSFAAGLALLLSCVGLYGLLSYEVARRTREIGVRMALGARRGDVLRMVLGRGLWLAVIGVALGSAVAAGVTRYLQSLLFGVKAIDPVTFAAIGALILCVSVAASYVPTRRATRVDPMVALRYE